MTLSLQPLVHVVDLGRVELNFEAAGPLADVEEQAEPERSA